MLEVIFFESMKHIPSMSSLVSCLLTLRLHLNDCDFDSRPLFLVSLFSLYTYTYTYQGDTALTTPPFFKNARRGAERIWGEETASAQPMVINWQGLTDMEKIELSHTLSTTNNWILLTHTLGAKNKFQPPLKESLMIARA